MDSNLRIGGPLNLKPKPWLLAKQYVGVFKNPAHVLLSYACCID